MSEETMAALRIVTALREESPRTATELAAAIGAPLPPVQQVCDELVEAGYLMVFEFAGGVRYGTHPRSPTSPDKEWTMEVTGEMLQEIREFWKADFKEHDLEVANQIAGRFLELAEAGALVLSNEATFFHLGYACLVLAEGFSENWKLAEDITPAEDIKGPERLHRRATRQCFSAAL